MLSETPLKPASFTFCCFFAANPRNNCENARNSGAQATITTGTGRLSVSADERNDKISPLGCHSIWTSTISIHTCLHKRIRISVSVSICRAQRLAGNEWSRSGDGVHQYVRFSYAHKYIGEKVLCTTKGDTISWKAQVRFDVGLSLCWAKGRVFSSADVDGTRT